MGRLEEAMEKAARLRGEAGAAKQTKTVEENAHSRLHEKPAEHIEIFSPRLVVANDYNLPISEEYRKLKSVVVQLTNGDRKYNTLMVTSSIGGEGKSVTALNLALTLAQGYDHRVVLIDTDLRNPSMYHYLGLKSRAGLTDCLMDGADLEDVLVNTGLGSLLVLPAGRSVTNPVEVLSSAKMTEFVDRMKQRFAGYYVIFDLSPVLPFAEARIVGSMVDGVIFVVKEGGASVKDVRDALEALKGTNILGVVYNKATTEGLSGGYHYYYDYNYQSRGEESSAKRPKEGILSRFLRGRAR
jgi:protein-tyrosine kinase